MRTTALVVQPLNQVDNGNTKKPQASGQVRVPVCMQITRVYASRQRTPLNVAKNIKWHKRGTQHKRSAKEQVTCV